MVNCNIINYIIMKRIIYICWSFLLFVACEKDIDMYEGQAGIYFDYEEMLLDTFNVSWGLEDSDIKEQTVKLKVMLMGNVADYDRPFEIEVVSDPADTLIAKEGVEYKPFPLKYVLPANEAVAYVEVRVLRSPVLKKESRHLTIRLKETPELKFLYSRQAWEDSVTYRDIDVQRVIKMTEDFPKPWWWYKYENVLGPYSLTKSILICDKMDIDRKVWIGELVGELTPGYLRFIGMYMHRWLQEQNPPILDEDGEPMEMGPESKL